jgi:hypothetical protein
MGTEGHDKVGGVVVNGIVPGDGEVEVMLDIFFLWASDLLTAFIDDSILMGVVGNSDSARQGGEEMGKEFSF